jgi:hypothetical protein
VRSIPVAGADSNQQITGQGKKKATQDHWQVCESLNRVFYVVCLRQRKRKGQISRHCEVNRGIRNSLSSFFMIRSPTIFSQDQLSRSDESDDDKPLRIKQPAIRKKRALSSDEEVITTCSSIGCCLFRIIV